MIRNVLICLGTIASISLMVSAFWVWQNAGALTYSGDRPELALWAARSAAIGLAAVAQFLIATLVLMRIYRRDWPSNIYGLGAALVVLMSLTGAVVLAVAGR